MSKNSNGKVALITGATGFVGAHLTRRLIEEGWETHIIVRQGSNLILFDDVADKIHVHRYNGHTQSIIDIVKIADPEIVFHLASHFLAQHSPEDVENLVQSNILFGLQLVEAMTLHEVTKLVNTGTSWQHFQNEDYNPVCLYAATKQAFDDLLRFYVETSGLKVITLKLFDTYGPNDPRAKLFSLLKKVASEDIELAMSPGEQLIDLVHIDDVVDAFLIAAGRLRKNKVSGIENYAVSSGNPVSLKELVALYGRITGKNLKINWGERPYRPREVMAPWNKGRKIPGWKPRIGLEEGIWNEVAL